MVSVGSILIITRRTYYVIINGGVCWLFINVHVINILCNNYLLITWWTYYVTINGGVC